MAGTWNGFTEEDIGYYQKIQEGPKKVSSAKKKNQRSQTENRNVSVESQWKIPDNARLCKGVAEERAFIEEEKTRPEMEGGPTITGSSPVCLKVMEGKVYELVNRNSTDVSKATLEVFEARQKMLEEENKKRKEMLAKVISDRRKQTTEEAKRLQHIQEELSKLDVLLSSDVGILRDKIEEASLDFVQAQKRYNKAEKEFLEAKQSLFSKLEKKELLTKLLCTIIEENEMRKAQKLSELMEKLNINETANDLMKQSALENPS